MQPLHSTAQLPIQAAAVVRVVELHVVDRDAALSQLGGEMPHGRQDQRNLLRMVPHVTAFGLDFDKEDAVAVRLEILQAGQAGTQLIAEYDTETAKVRHAGPDASGQP